MMRWDIINHLIKKNNYKTYIEIGYFKGWSFDRIECESKTAVDPNPSKTEDQMNMRVDSEQHSLIKDESGEYSRIHNLWKMTSDKFFSTIPKDRRYDIVFIDGLHESTQVDRDIQNALKHLNKGGTIVMHDCLPTSLEMVTTGTQLGEWTGDCYKSFINFTTGGRCDFAVVDTDYGVGIIQNYIGLPQSMNLDYSFEDFQKDKNKLMNIISVEEFLKREAINQEENV